MELLMRMYDVGTAVKYVIPSPGQGYITNWNIIFYDRGGESSSIQGDFVVSKHAVNFDTDRIRKAPIYVRLDTSLASINRYMSKKKLFLDYQDHMTFAWNVESSSTLVVYLQATFVPKKNSLLRVTRTMTINEGLDIRTSGYLVPHNMRLHQVDVKATVTADTTGGIVDIGFHHAPAESYISGGAEGVANVYGESSWDDTEETNYGLQYGQDRLFSIRAPAEVDNPKSYERKYKMSKPVAVSKYDWIYPNYTAFTGTAPTEVILEYTMYFQYIGDNEREFIEEYYLYESPSFIDQGLIENPVSGVDKP